MTSPKSTSLKDEHDCVKKSFFIEPIERADICFKENLILVDENKNKRGDIIIRIEEISDGVSGFLVHISSKQCVHNQSHEMSITSKVTYGLRTIEEIRTEITNYGQIKKKLYLSSTTDMYEISVTTKFIGDQHENKTYSEILIDDCFNLISEGANVILLRQIALSGYAGKFSANAILINGVICTAEYIAEPESISEALLYPQQIKLVMRNITVNQKLSSVILEHITILTRRGQIFRHKWTDSSLTVQIDAKNVIKDTNVLSVDIPSKTCWKDDMELSSIFRDKVFESLLTNQSYLNDNQQVSHLIQDFVTHVLLKKPEDPIRFAIKFFTR